MIVCGGVSGLRIIGASQLRWGVLNSLNSYGDVFELLEVDAKHHFAESVM
jgi:hypothetical protein